MKSFLNEITDAFKVLEESCDKCGKPECDCEGEIDEACKEHGQSHCEECNGVIEQSTSGAAGGYQTPNAFSKKEKTKMKYPGVAESTEQRYEKLIHTIAKLSEGSYRDFKTDPNKTPAKKVNGAIREIAQKLKEIETLAMNAAKLKNEQGVTQDHYWKSSSRNLENVGRRLIKISERVRALGA